MTPAETMRAAAAKLRELAAQAEGATDVKPQPWTYEDGMIWDDGGFSVLSVRAEEGQWIALLGPDKAELLADWLETEARCTGIGDTVAKDTTGLLDAIAGETLALKVTFVADTSRPALEFAHAILGSQP